MRSQSISLKVARIFTAAMLMLSTIEAGSMEQYPKLRMHGGTILMPAKLVEEVMANGRAWGVTFRVEGEKNIHVQYFQDEACVRGIALSFVKKKWIIDEVSQACD
jgi:hypothetical protein